MPPREPLNARWYRRLLRLFPFDFQREFGSEMTDVFEAQRRDAVDTGGTAMFRLWFDTILGFFRTAPGEHLATIRQDLRQVIRSLRAAPAFTATAVAALAIGIGGNVTVFSLVEAVLLNPLPVREPSRLGTIQVVDHKNPASGYTPLSTDNFRDVEAQQTSFASIAGYVFAGVRLTAEGTEPQELFASTVTGRYFEVLGVHAAIGRTISPSDETGPAAGPVAVLGHSLWVRAFGADPAVVGRTIGLNGRPFTVIGVMPAAFRGTQVTFETDLYLPLPMYDVVSPGTPWFQGRRWRWLNVIGRLAPSETMETAHTAVEHLGNQLAEAYPDVNAGRTLAVVPLLQTAVNPNQYGTVATAGLMLLAVAGVVLLIACVNLANLLLARAAGRSREVALRTALGASRLRLIRALLTESVVLGLAGGTAGLAIAFGLQRWLWSARPNTLAQPAIELSLGGEVLAFAFLTSVVAGVLFGLVPALQVSRTDVIRTLQQSGRQATAATSARLQGALVIGEVALSVVALIAAGLFIRSLQGAQRIDPGFDTEQLVRLSYNLRGGGYDSVQARDFHERVIEALGSTPGIEGVAVSNRGPLGGGGGNTLNVAGRQPPPGSMGTFAQMAWVSPGYFDTMGIPVARGREFGREDRSGVRMVGIVNETLARQFWPDDDPIGRQFTSTSLPTPVEVVGVAEDSKYVSIGEAPQPFFYLPLLQQDGGQATPVTLLVAASGPPEHAVPVIRDVVARLDASLPLTNIQTGEDLLAAALWGPRMAATLVSAFGVLALLLAAVGLYGVMAYTVAQGRQEMGLRLALGATPAGLIGMVLGRGIRLTATGVAAGVALGLLTSGTLSSLLYDVDARDPVAFVAAPAGLVLVATLACLIPAARAARLDPARTLRE